MADDRRGLAGHRRPWGALVSGNKEEVEPPSETPIGAPRPQMPPLPDILDPKSKKTEPSPPAAGEMADKTA